MSNGDFPEPTKTTRQLELEELSKQLFRDGKVIEAGWTALLAQAIPARIQEKLLGQMRAIYFAGAKHTFTHSSPQVSDDQETTDVYMARLKLMHVELDGFTVEVDERWRSMLDGRAGQE